MKQLVLILLTWLMLSNSGRAETPFTLPPNDENQTRSQGSRGCPEALGELILIGGPTVTTQGNPPTLLFWINSTNPQTVLLTLNYSYSQRLDAVFEERAIVRGPGYFTLTIDRPLDAGIAYQLTVGILCQESVENAAILNTTLQIVSKPAPNDRLIAVYLASPAILEATFEKKEKVHSRPSLSL